MIEGLEQHPSLDAIKHAVRSPLQLSLEQWRSALVLALPSRLEVAIKVSDSFLRINSGRPGCRWGRLGASLLVDAHSGWMPSLCANESSGVRCCDRNDGL